MTVAAPARVTVPVAASAALRPVLAGPADGALLGAGASGAWVRLGDEVLVLTPPGEVRFPNGVEVPAALLRELQPGAACRAGGGSLDTGGWRLEVRASWDPRPRLPRVDPSLVRAAAAALAAPAVDGWGLAAAMAEHNATAALAAAHRLIGSGPGLTPLGDDVVVAALAGSLLLGEAVGSRGLVRFAAGLAGPLDSLARERTTMLSATLLRHACRGEVDDASAALLQALCGRGDPAAALAALLAVGHTSGGGLAAGILAAAAAAGRAC
jgi:hypothetical protein